MRRTLIYLCFSLLVGCAIPSYGPYYEVQEQNLGNYSGASFEIKVPHNYGKPVISLKITLPDNVRMRILEDSIWISFSDGEDRKVTIDDPVTLYDANDGTIKVREVALSSEFMGETAMAATGGVLRTKLTEVHDTVYLYARMDAPPETDFRVNMPRIEINSELIDLGVVTVHRRSGVLFQGNW